MRDGVTFHKENMGVLFGEGKDLLRRHYLEIAHYQDIPLMPDEDAYYMMEHNHSLHVFTARENQKLIGYSVYMIRKNIHYRSSRQALQDIIYIDKERRGFGMEFIKWCDEQLKKLDVQTVYHHVKAKHDFGPGLKRLGYELIDYVYGRRLDKNA